MSTLPSSFVGAGSPTDFSDTPIDIFSLGRGIASFSSNANIEQDGRRADDHLPTGSADIAPESPSVGAEEGADGAGWEHRQSMYVRIVDEMLDTVLKHEKYLFTKREVAVLETFRVLECEFRFPPLFVSPLPYHFPLRNCG